MKASQHYLQTLKLNNMWHDIRKSSQPLCYLTYIVTGKHDKILKNEENNLQR